jgi:hypothetical protein
LGDHRRGLALLDDVFDVAGVEPDVDRDDRSADLLCREERLEEGIELCERIATGSPGPIPAASRPLATRLLARSIDRKEWRSIPSGEAMATARSSPNR